MAIKARYVIDQAKGLLNDPSGRRWPDADLIKYLNDGQRRIVTLMPSVNSSKHTYQLTPGVVQSIPDGTLAISAFVRNQGLDGSTAGNAIDEFPRQLLDDIFPDWAADTESVSVAYAMYKRLDNPKIFEVYPPQPDPAGYIEVEAADEPADCTLSSHDGSSTGSADSNIDIDPMCADALLYFVMFKAHSRDFRYSVRKLAESYWNKMLSELGLSNQRETAESAKIEGSANASGVQ